MRRYNWNYEYHNCPTNILYLGKVIIYGAIWFFLQEGYTRIIHFCVVPTVPYRRILSCWMTIGAAIGIIDRLVLVSVWQNRHSCRCVPWRTNYCRYGIICLIPLSSRTTCYWEMKCLTCTVLFQGIFEKQHVNNFHEVILS